jgi:hypothetical protein
LREGAERAEQISAQAEARVAQLEAIALALPANTPYHAEAVSTLEFARDAAALAKESASARRSALVSAEKAQAAGGGILEILLAVAAGLIPGGVAAYAAVQKSRQSYGAMRQTFRGIEDSKDRVDPAAMKMILDQLAVSQDEKTKALIDKLQGKA